MIFDFSNFRLDIDVESTKSFYSKHGKTAFEDCGCVNCQNYYVAICKVLDKVKAFSSIGIDP